MSFHESQDVDYNPPYWNGYSTDLTDNDNLHQDPGTQISGSTPEFESIFPPPQFESQHLQSPILSPMTDQAVVQDIISGIQDFQSRIQHYPSQELFAPTSSGYSPTAMPAQAGNAALGAEAPLPVVDVMDTNATARLISSIPLQERNPAGLSRAELLQLVEIQQVCLSQIFLKLPS
ncbi:hypothetical protein BT63DRAFT_140837 [Microthyrium microscopicum]|uniref:Uncharacterized protein n=1 Tax=Microthyrium microscopicum TaxID=703497 RepID=A0A6A6UKZ8_9PEZI|nr:hypothetical protein BT63DRAFT_140837 [Microthyrium microscopicum]